MSPRHQLMLSVAIVATVIAVVWVVLFRSHALAPSVAVPAGPSLPEIGKQFDAEIEQFNRLLEPTVNGAPTANIPPANVPPPAPVQGGSASGGNASTTGGASDDVRASTTP